MLEPDFWRGKGRYSKQAISRKIRDDCPLTLPDSPPETAKKE
jgi:hypothetical protein